MTWLKGKGVIWPLKSFREQKEELLPAHKQIHIDIHNFTFLWTYDKMHNSVIYITDCFHERSFWI